MATTIRLFQKVNLPTDGYPIMTKEQLTFFEDPAPTEINRLGECEDERYTKYRVKHASILTIEGQVHGMKFDRCLRFQNFPCFESNFAPWVISASVAGSVAAKAFRRLKGSTMVRIEPVEINLLEAKAVLTSSADARIRSGWFSGLQIDKVEVAYINGGAVGDSNDWERYESYGSIACLQMELPYLDSTMIVQISKDGTVTFAKSLSEQEYLAYATNIFGYIYPPDQLT